MREALHKNILSLRDITITELEAHKAAMSEVVYRRCSFILNENQRLLEACELLRANDLEGFGQLMYATHEGLSKWYEVSCPELDFLQEKARKHEGVSGARMMGGGFGGCTINIVETSLVDAFSTYIAEAYQKEYSKIPEIYVTQLDDGAGIISY
jgi:galactokinase